jgi:hypothetical protein
MKFRLVAALILIQCLALEAQPVLGVRAGISLANVRHINKWDFNYGSHINYYTGPALREFVGMYLEQPIKKSFLFQTELCYLGLGMRSRWISNDPVKLNYLAIPVSLKYQAGDVRLTLGLYGAYRLESSRYADFSKWDYGLHSGAEYILPIKKNIEVGVRYFHGLHNFYVGDVNYFTWVTEYYNRGIQFYVSFPLGQRTSAPVQNQQ